ncbi:MAG: hypothetical protein AAF639_03070 [Chloroflexota bacterium]
MSTQATIQETNAEAFTRIWHLFEKTDEQMKETDRRMKESERRLRKLEGRYGNEWGDLVEALVAPGAVKLFRERGIDVTRNARNLESERNGDHMELDLVLQNGEEMVIVEIKSKLKSRDVDDFLEDLSRLYTFFPDYQQYNVFGAVAGLHVDKSAARYAYRKGLFVVAVTGDDMVSILNDDKFRPRDFSS